MDMNGFGNQVVKHRKLILLFAVILLVPSVIGMALTRINYDMLNYLPDDIETMKRFCRRISAKARSPF